MKSSSLFSLLSILALAVADVNNYYFYAVTDDGDSEVDNLYVQAALETDDTVYFFLGAKSEAVTFACDTSANKCTVSFQDQIFQIGSNDDFFVVGVIDGAGISPYVSLETDADSMITYGGVYIDGYDFHAKKNADDPISYSKDKFSLLVEGFVADSSTYGFKLYNEKAPRNATADAGVFNPSSIVIEDDAETETETGTGSDDTETGSGTVIFNETESESGSSSARNVSSVSATLTKSGSKSTTFSSSHVTSTTNSDSAKESPSSETSEASETSGSSSSATSETGSSNSATTGSQTSSGGAQSKYFCSGIGIIAIFFALI
ncbi:hypothetical protein CLIB1423_09S04016 [[Candida] railenensis]|uniref:Uncharacterized protein n=1 Tax=[Candida] railenensis TaxID=45579 RepID=A0A9P0QR61_9ASCO|nr:hypothetical protein CLIB1423_09S04016 [[Candida] railenensis]